MPQNSLIYVAGKSENVSIDYEFAPPDYYSISWVSGYRYSYFDSNIGCKYRSFTGTKTPNFRQYKKLHGFLPTLPCTDERYETTARSAQYFRYGYWDGRKTGWKILRQVGSPISVTQDTSVKNLAWSKLRQLVMDQDFNSGVVLAEAHKTSDLIYGTARRLSLAIRALRKGDIRKVTEYLPALKSMENRGLLKDLRKDIGLTKDEVHRYWLELQYGWKPLLMDVHGAAVALAKTNVPKRDILHVRTVSRSSTKVTRDRNGMGLIGSADHEGRAWMTYKVRNDGLVAANKLGLLNPLMIAWELVPFSFVADWFVNIGDVIQESTAFAGLDILDAGSSYKQTVSGECRTGNFAEPNLYTQKYVFYNRTAGAQTVPQLMFKKNPFSTGHILNGVALLREVTRK